MESKQVQKWIEDFFDGKTTLAQEKALVAYFAQDNIHESLQAYRPYFNAVMQERQQRSSVSFSPQKSIKKWLRYSSVAAAVLLLILFAKQAQQPAQPTAEELAFEEFKANMYLVAQQLNKGKQGIAYMETFHQTTHKYIKND